LTCPGCEIQVETPLATPSRSHLRFNRRKRQPSLASMSDCRGIVHAESERGFEAFLQEASDGEVRRFLADLLNLASADYRRPDA